MTREEFEQLAGAGVILLDGATGSNLTKAGMPKGVSTELWVLEHPDILANLQKAYVEAGSQIVYAPTFGANRLKLADYGRENEVEELNARLVDISKKVGYEDSQYFFRVFKKYLGMTPLQYREESRK